MYELYVCMLSCEANFQCNWLHTLVGSLLTCVWNSFSLSQYMYQVYSNVKSAESELSVEFTYFALLKVCPMTILILFSLFEQKKNYIYFASYKTFFFS